MSLFTAFKGSYCRRGNDLTEFVCTKFQVVAMVLACPALHRSKHVTTLTPVLTQLEGAGREGQPHYSRRIAR